MCFQTCVWIHVDLQSSLGCSDEVSVCFQSPGGRGSSRAAREGKFSGRGSGPTVSVQRRPLRPGQRHEDTGDHAGGENVNYCLLISK